MLHFSEAVSSLHTPSHQVFLQSRATIMDYKLELVSDTGCVLIDLSRYALIVLVLTPDDVDVFAHSSCGMTGSLQNLRAVTTSQSLCIRETSPADHPWIDHHNSTVCSDLCNHLVAQQAVM